MDIALLIIVSIVALAASIIIAFAVLDERLLKQDDRKVLEEWASVGRVRVFGEPRPGATWHAGPYPDATEIVDAVNAEPCHDCHGARCWAWRDSGHTRGCGNFPAPGNSYVNLAEAVERPGRHTVRETVRRWVDHDWNPLSLTVRTSIAPTAWSRRLPAVVWADDLVMVGAT